MTTTYTAAVALSPDVTPGEFCQVSVFPEGTPDPPPVPGTEAVLGGLALTVRVDDPDRLGKAGKAAADALARHGWVIRGPWWASDNALYAEAVPAAGNPLYLPAGAARDRG